MEDLVTPKCRGRGKGGAIISLSEWSVLWKFLSDSKVTSSVSKSLEQVRRTQHGTCLCRARSSGHKGARYPITSYTKGLCARLRSKRHILLTCYTRDSQQLDTCCSWRGLRMSARHFVITIKFSWILRFFTQCITIVKTKKTTLTHFSNTDNLFQSEAIYFLTKNYKAHHSVCL